MYKEHIIVKQTNTHNRVKVERATYVDGYRLLISFTDQKQKMVDFGNFLKAKGHGFLSKYKNPNNFKKFKIENGNLVWGKNWDIIFPIDTLYRGYID